MKPSIYYLSLHFSCYWNRKYIPLIEIDIKSNRLPVLIKEEMLLEQKFYISHLTFSAKRSEKKKYTSEQNYGFFFLQKAFQGQP